MRTIVALTKLLFLSGYCYFLTGCGILNDGYKYEATKRFKHNMDEFHNEYAAEFLTSDMGSHIVKGQITTYFKDKTSEMSGTILTGGAVLTALVAGFGWLRSRIKWKKQQEPA